MDRARGEMLRKYRDLLKAKGGKVTVRSRGARRRRLVEKKRPKADIKENDSDGEEGCRVNQLSKGGKLKLVVRKTIAKK